MSDRRDKPEEGTEDEGEREFQELQYVPKPVVIVGVVRFLSVSLSPVTCVTMTSCCCNYVNYNTYVYCIMYIIHYTIYVIQYTKVLQLT